MAGAEDQGDGQLGPGRALVASVTDTAAMRHLKGAWRAARDAAQASGVVAAAMNELPLLRWVVGGHNAVAAVRDRLLMEKIARFLEPLWEIDEGARRRWAEELERDPDERERVGSHLMATLDRQDDPRKARVLGLLWAAHIRGDLERRHLELLAAALDRVHLAHLQELYALQAQIEREQAKERAPGEDWDASESFARIVLLDLLQANLIHQPNEGGWRDIGDPRYGPTPLGDELMRVLDRDELPE